MSIIFIAMVAATGVSVVFVSRCVMSAAAVSNMMVVIVTTVSRVAMVIRSVKILLNNAKLFVAMEIDDFQLVVMVTSDHAAAGHEDEGDAVEYTLTGRLVHPVPLHNVKREAPETDKDKIQLSER